MDRLNFRKKMAVFISLVMILQVVLCNVGYAETTEAGSGYNVDTIRLGNNANSNNNITVNDNIVTINVNENREYEIEGGFEKDDGGSGENQDREYTIDLSEGCITEKVITYTVGEVNVTITLPDDITINNDNTVKLKEDTVLTLNDNFNAENMQVKLTASDGFSTTLTVKEQKTTSICAKDCEGLPDATMK